MAETLRSLVHPWECDSVEHFTTAYYYQAFSAAQWHLLQLIGCSAEEIATLRPASCRTGFRRELRAGDAFHIESGVVEQEAGAVTTGHKLYNSEDGTLCATHELTLEGTFGRAAPEHSIDWDIDEPGSELDFTGPARWSTSSVGVLQERDLDHTGRLDLSSLIHHASDASVQFQNMIGMTSSYMQEKHIGFATFAYQIRVHRLPRTPGTVLKTESSLAHLGRSSLWFAHRTTDGTTGTILVDIAQFGVHLDRIARRPATIPDEVREPAEAFLR